MGTTVNRGNAMSEVETLQHDNSFFRIRRDILKMLYTFFKEYPYAQIELKDIEKECRTNTKDLNWNIVYLEKCGYIELGKSTESFPYVACSASITAAGVDLAEDKKAFNKRFPVEDDHRPKS